MRRLMLAALLFALPVSAAAQRVVVGGIVPLTKALPPKEAAALQDEFSAALQQAGILVVEGAARHAGVEFVASVSVDREGEELVFVAQLTRLHLDRYVVRNEVRAPADDAEARAEAMGQLAALVQTAIDEAPDRDPTQPAPPSGPRRIAMP